MDEQPSLSDVNTELLFLLGASNPNWERIQKLFKTLLETDFASVPAQLIQKLGIYYLQNLERGQPLDGMAVEACLLSQRAHGYPLPPLLADNLQRWNASQPVRRPPFPKPVAWSTSALMQLDSAASMDSPIIHVWVYNDEKGIPVEVIICGQGIGWIREKVDNAVLSTALRLSTKSADVLLEGLTCLQLTPEEIAQSVVSRDKQTLFTAENILTGGKSQVSAFLQEDLSPADSMKELVGELVELETKTGLVEVIKRPYALRAEYQGSIRTKAREHRSEGISLWQNTATEDERVIFPHPVILLNINLPFSLVESTAFKTLHDLYRNDIVRAAAADALRRLNFYTTNLTEHVDNLKVYLDPTRRGSLPESVQLELQIDYETGLSYRLKDPVEKTRDEYYGKHVPILIKKDIIWIRKIKKLLHNLSTAISQPDSNLNRLTLARLFDAALRDIPLVASPEVNQVFADWKKKAQPLLWYLWENALKSHGLKPENFASRQQFFMLDIDAVEKAITIRPFILTDTKTTLFVFDSRYPTPLLHSLYDKLTEVGFNPEPEKAQKSLARWKAQLLSGNMTESRESLELALVQDPEVVVREIVDAYQKPFVPASSFEDQATRTKQKLFPLLAHNLGVRLWSHNAFQSGYSILQKALTQIQNEPGDSRLHNLTDIPLTLAWLKAVCYFGKEIPHHLKRLRHGFPANQAEKEIQYYLNIAAQLDGPHVAKCLDKKDLLFSKSLKELRTLVYLNAADQSIFNILRALAFVQAAQDISLRIEEMQGTGESPRSIYAKFAPAADGIWSNLYIQDVSDQMDDLVNMLLGHEVV